MSKKKYFYFLIFFLTACAISTPPNSETPPAQPAWVKREEQVQLFAVRPLAEQIFFVTDQNYYLFPLSSKLTAVLQMPQRNHFDIATHRFEQVGDVIRGNLVISLRLNDARNYSDELLKRMGFQRTIDANLGDVWRMTLVLDGKIFAGGGNIPANLRLPRPYNIYIYQQSRGLTEQNYPPSPITNLAQEKLILFTTPIWFIEKEKTVKKSGS